MPPRLGEDVTSIARGRAIQGKAALPGSVGVAWPYDPRSPHMPSMWASVCKGDMICDGAGSRRGRRFQREAALSCSGLWALPYVRRSHTIGVCYSIKRTGTLLTLYSHHVDPIFILSLERRVGRERAQHAFMTPAKSRSRPARHLSPKLPDSLRARRGRTQ